MDNYIYRDDCIIGYVDDLKRYFKKCVKDRVDCHSLNDDWVDEISDYVETLKELDDFDDEALVVIQACLMGGVSVKEMILKEREGK